MPRLIIFDDQVRGVDLPKAPVIIGRSKKADIPIHDDILSRKHCAILPNEIGYRLVDLMSSNGTFLNGEQVDKIDLSYDDILEIGNTVMVFMDSDVWKRGEGLAKLRNPVKAQELIQRMKVHKDDRKPIPVRAVSRRKPASRRRRDLIRSLPALQKGPLRDSSGQLIEAKLFELLADYSVHKAVSLLVQSRPKLRRMVAESVETALVEMLSGNWDDLRSRIRASLHAKLACMDGDRDGGDETPVEAPEAGPERTAREQVAPEQAATDGQSAPAAP